VTNADRSAGWVTGASPTNGSARPPAGDADAAWRRPTADTPSLAPPATGEPPAEQPEYAGPPHGTPPPSSWRPPVVAPTVPPRDMPAQDHSQIDAEERGARTLTQGIALVAGAIILILFFILCAKII